MSRRETWVDGDSSPHAGSDAGGVIAAMLVLSCCTTQDGTVSAAYGTTKLGAKVAPQAPEVFRTGSATKTMTVDVRYLDTDRFATVFDQDLTHVWTP